MTTTADREGITLLHVVGARPNFMKVAPVLAAGRQHDLVRQVLVHTGQHYDAAMSDRFFADLGLPDPDEHLGVGAGTHAEQTARIMLGFEPVLERHRPDWVVVYGDVNSTVACALVAAKRGVRVAHVEAGLRSRDRSMPEELNRIVTDQLADLLLTPSRDADRNLEAEGIATERIRFVGNVMVDTLLTLRARAAELAMPAQCGLVAGHYAFVTLHRPSNVDHPAVLGGLLDGLATIARQMPVVFAVHPRTRQRMTEHALDARAGTVQLREPLGYLETIGLVESAALVITDSGGLQEETTVLGVPCLTARPNTERPVTITEGTNRLIGSTAAEVIAGFEAARKSAPTGPRRPEGWDGKAGRRVLESLLAASGIAPGEPAPSRPEGCSIIL